MKLKKIISIVISILLLTCHISASAEETTLAEETPTLIAYPVDGAKVEDDFSAIELSTESDCQITAILDGKEIASFISQGDDTITLPKTLSVGKHSLVAVKERNNDVSAQRIEFDVYKDVAETNIDKTSFASAFWSGSTQTAGKGSDGSTISIQCLNLEGKDGTENKAIGFMTTGEVTDTSGTTETYYLMKPVGADAWSGIVEFEYDLKITGNIMFEIETKNGQGAFGYLGKRNMIYNGVIAGTSQTYPTDSWIHVKHIIDLPNEKESLLVDDTPILNNSPLTTAKNIIQLKLQARVLMPGAKMGCAIDNLNVVHWLNTNGIDSVSYYNGSEYAIAPNDIITEETNKIKLNVSSPTMTDIADAKGLVTIACEGKQLPLAAASVDADGNIDAELESNLPKFGTLTASVACTAPDGSTYTAEKTFEMSVPEFGITDISYKVNGSECYSGLQLKAGDECKTVFELKNNSGNPQNAVIIMAVYDGNRIASLTAKDLAPGAEQTEFSETLSVILPAKSNDFNVECYMLSDFAGCRVLSKVWKLK